MSISILKQKIAKNSHKEHIAFGNFNLYHELWKEPDALKTYIEKSKEFLIAMSRWETEQIVLTSIATNKKFIEESIIDLIFITTILLKSLIFCTIAEKLNYDSDHQPILL